MSVLHVALTVASLARAAGDSLPPSPADEIARMSVAPLPDVPRPAPEVIAWIQGRVEGFGTAALVAGAQVRALDREGRPVGAALTGADGRFDLAVPAGSWAVEVSHPAWGVLSLEEEIEAGALLEVRYRLRPLPSGETVVVWGKRERTEISRQVYDRDTLREIPGSFGDPVRALQSLPGVARPQSLEGSLVVRGAEGMNTGFYVDEMPVPFLFHLLVGKSVIDPAFVDDVEFFPGGMPSRFGEVTQAAVNVRTDRDPVEGRRSLFDLNVLDVGGAVEAEVRGWQVRASLRHSWVSFLIGTVAGIIVLREGGDWEDAEYVYPRYWDLLLSGKKRLADGADWSVSLLASRDGQTYHEGCWQTDEAGDCVTKQERYDLPFDPNDYIDNGFGRLRLRRIDAGGDHRSDTWVAGGPQVQQNLLGDMLVNKEGPYYGRVDGWTAIARREDTWTRSEDQRLLAGGQATVTRVTAQDWLNAFADPVNIPTTRDTQVLIGAFGEWQWAPGPWTLVPGLRGSVYHFDGGWWIEPEPRLTARWALGDAWVAKAFVGRFTQMPPIETYAQGIGNPDLPLMTAWQSAIGGEWRSGPWSLDTSLFASRMAHLVVRDEETRLHAAGREGRTGFYEASVPIFLETTGFAYGWESIVRLDPARGWWGWVALTLSRSLRETEDGNVFPGDYDEPFSLTVLAARDLPRRWKASARFRWTSGHPYTPYTGVYDPGYDSWRGMRGDLNAARYSAFDQLDVRIEKTWERRKGDWSLYLDVYNAYWAKNPFAVAYNYDYSELLDIISLPIIPTLGLEAAF